MLVFSTPPLAFIAVPKTGTTALEMALRPHADIAFQNDRKHMNAQRFHNRVAPFLEQTFKLRPERFAVIREPEDQLRSWYRYRARDEMAGTEKSTAQISFDRFVQDVISATPPQHASVGSQWKMLTSGRGKLLVHHLFAYDRQPVLLSFLSRQFGTEIALKSFNVSAPIDAELSDETRQALRAAREPEFSLYDAVQAQGGHLRSDLKPSAAAGK